MVSKLRFNASQGIFTPSLTWFVMIESMESSIREEEEVEGVDKDTIFTE